MTPQERQEAREHQRQAERTEAQRRGQVAEEMPYLDELPEWEIQIGVTGEWE